MEWMGPEPAGTLDAWMQQWVEGFLRAGGAVFVFVLVGLVLVAALGAWGAKVVRRRFRCRLAGREVDVEFQPRIASIKSCSAFEPATAVTCGRQCLDAKFREEDGLLAGIASAESCAGPACAGRSPGLPR